ncbi:MAG: RNA polymerase factor sigma-54, partial [Burkholderiales bacterium]|nr:RNA polymerase factor sigma-54 [Burkholderiales bacterium]
AARSPAECLALQLEAQPAEAPGRALALEIVREHLATLAAHDTARLLQALGCDEAALRRAHELIQRLDPHPGSRFGTLGVHAVVADVVVRKLRGRWIAGINPQVLPRIRVNELYADIYRGSREGNAGLSQQLQEARWLVRNAQQRFQTIQRVAQAIVERQSRYFDYGDVAMKPLLQRDIAREVGVHESTVSRVASGKYMITPRGLIEFKHFFGTQVVGEDGHACSSTAIRALIRQIIAHEPAGAPLSDIKVTRKLGEYGIRVARRTVTKYRDAMRIPPVEARRLGAPSDAAAGTLTQA